MQIATHYANHQTAGSRKRSARKMMGRRDAAGLEASQLSPLPARRHRAESKPPTPEFLPPVSVLEDAVRKELASLNGQEELFLRSTSDLSCLLRDISQDHGRSYFRYVLRDVFGDKSQVYNVSSTPTQILAYSQTILKRMARAIHFAPLVLRASAQYVLSEFEREFPHCQTSARIVVGGIIFLRILCPALVKPEIFGFEPHNAKSLPACVQIAKLLQSTLRGQLSHSTQPEGLTPNDFIALYHPFVDTFLARFPQLTSNVHQLHRPATVTRFASWDELDTSRSAPEIPSSCRSNEDEVSRFRGMSMTTPEDLSQRKKKFSLKFW